MAVVQQQPQQLQQQEEESTEEASSGPRDLVRIQSMFSEWAHADREGSSASAAAAVAAAAEAGGGSGAAEGHLGRNDDPKQGKQAEEDSCLNGDDSLVSVATAVRRPLGVPEEGPGSGSLGRPPSAFSFRFRSLPPVDQQHQGGDDGEEEVEGEVERTPMGIPEYMPFASAGVAAAAEAEGGGGNDGQSGCAFGAMAEPPTADPSFGSTSAPLPHMFWASAAAGISGAATQPWAVGSECKPHPNGSLKLIRIGDEAQETEASGARRTTLLDYELLNVTAASGESHVIEAVEEAAWDSEEHGKDHDIHAWLTQQQGADGVESVGGGSSIAGTAAAGNGGGGREGAAREDTEGSGAGLWGRPPGEAFVDDDESSLGSSAGGRARRLASLRQGGSSGRSFGRMDLSAGEEDALRSALRASIGQYSSEPKLTPVVFTLPSGGIALGVRGGGGVSGGVTERGWLVWDMREWEQE